MMLNAVYDVLDPGDEKAGAFPARLHLGLISPPSGNPEQPHHFAYWKSRRVGLLVIARLHSFAGHI